MHSTIEDILNGRTEEFRVLIRTYNDDLLRFSFQFFNDWDEAEETTQKTWIKVYNSLKLYQSDKPFKTWLYTIHLNMCKTHYRQSFWKRFTKLPNQSTPMEFHQMENDMVDIFMAMSKLTWRQKSIYIMCELHELSSVVAGKILGISDKTVRVQLSKAKQVLRLELKK